MEEYKKLKWHPAFYAGVTLDFKEEKSLLTFDQEHELSKEPIKMDMLIIKKKPNSVLKNPIGAMFRGFNVIEYKSPDDKLTINNLFKAIGYAALYKGYSTSQNPVPASELTISIFRHAYPKKMFKDLRKFGATIEKVAPGIYYIKGVISIPVQIVVTRELEEGKHTALTILTHGAKESEIKSFIEDARQYKLQEDKDNADALLQVSASANKSLFEKIRSEEHMCEALKEIMKDEINAEVKDACDKLASEKDAEFANVLAEKDAEFANVLSEKDAAFASVIAEKDAEFANSLSEKDARIAELEAQIKSLTK